MKKMKKMMAAVALALAGMTGFAAGGSSETYSFTYQACLRDDKGEPIKEGGVVKRNQRVTIRLWDDPASTAVKPLWARKYAVYTDETGLFNLEVSDATSDDTGSGDGYDEPKFGSLAEALRSEDAGNLYIGLFVEGSAGEIVPRQRLFAVPYAAVANDVRAISADIAAGGKITFGDVNAGLTLSKDGIQQIGSKNNSDFQAIKVGTLQVRTEIKGDGDTVKVANNLSISNDATVSGKATVGKDATVNGNLTVGGTITAGSSEVVPVPVGGIIMWTKSEPPEGGSWGSNGASAHWAICKGQTVNKMSLPDLRGQFVVGVNNSTTGTRGNGFPAYSYGATGGSNAVALETKHMPAHTHLYVTEGQLAGALGNNNGWGENDLRYKVGKVHTTQIGDHPKVGFDWHSDANNMGVVEVGMTGGDGTMDGNYLAEGHAVPHENRPPYFALYYIMRIK